MFQTLFRLSTTVAFVVFASAPAAAQPTAEQPGEDGAEQQAEQQADDEEPSSSFDREHRIEIYESSRLQPWRAVGYTALFPGLGNFYVDQYALGTVALSTMVFTGMFVAFGTMYDQPDLLTLGIVTGSTAYLGGGLSSYLGARHHNRELQRNLHIDDEYEASLRRHGPAGLSLQLQFRF